ncbi:MAG: FAD-dependent oxidoreductase [Myxococcota bacterium]|nr:FAD-dependent oxidoreductase [Myxococcota bacterium]
MKRAQMWARFDSQARWDLVIVGGGATGLGAALEAAQRGLSVALLERGDFAQGTSSRSTKLVHGGVRYLRQGQLSLVRSALHERGRLNRNAPHLVRRLGFIIPCYRWGARAYYSFGLKLYDILAGSLGLGACERLSAEEVAAALPGLSRDGLRGGVRYYDGQFDDARLALSIAQSAVERGAALVNHCAVEGLIHNEAGRVTGVRACDQLTGAVREIYSRAVLNATGVFVDDLRQLEDPESPSLVQPSQGAHIVLDRSFLGGEEALMVPSTDDGRVLFAIPWHDRLVVGTTDTPVAEASSEPRPLEEELDFILSHCAKYLQKAPRREDVLSCFAGLRPLIKASGSTASLSRDHQLFEGAGGMLTITGGKWTTYRKMGEEAIQAIARVADLELGGEGTESLPLTGWSESDAAALDSLSVRGSDRAAIDALIDEEPALGEPLHPRLPYCYAEVIHAVRAEMAERVEDVLSRRTRSLLLDAAAAREAAPKVAALMAEELGHDASWVEEEVRAFDVLSERYLLSEFERSPEERSSAS